jgi:ribosomal-protein-alanine N-acetyltransferase
MPTIRNAREDEAVELTRVGLNAWESATIGWLDVSALRDNAERAFLDFCTRHFLTIDVAEKNGQITGWAAREKLDNHITDLWIDPVWQRQGFGSKLLQAVEEEILAQGYDRVTVETNSQNTGALKFFGHHGYSISWMTTTWSAKLDRDVDTVGLVKILVKPEEVTPYSEF